MAARSICLNMSSNDTCISVAKMLAVIVIRVGGLAGLYS